MDNVPEPEQLIKPPLTPDLVRTIPLDQVQEGKIYYIQYTPYNLAPLYGVVKVLEHTPATIQLGEYYRY